MFWTPQVPGELLKNHIISQRLICAARKVFSKFKWTKMRAKTCSRFSFSKAANPTHPFAFLAAYHPGRSSHRVTLIGVVSGRSAPISVLFRSSTLLSPRIRFRRTICGWKYCQQAVRRLLRNHSGQMIFAPQAAILLIGLAFLKVHGIGRRRVTWKMTRIK